MPEVGRVLLWSEAVTELCLEFTHLFRPIVPTSSKWVGRIEGITLDRLVYLLHSLIDWQTTIFVSNPRMIT